MAILESLHGFFSNVYFLSQFVRAAALYLSKELTLLVTLVYSSLIGVTLSVFLMLTVALCTILHKITLDALLLYKCNVCFFLYFWMEYLFILDQKASVDFSVVFFFFLSLLTRSDSCLFECSHKSHNLKK